MKERYSQLKEEEKLFWHLITDKFNSSNILRKLENLLENPPFTVDISSVNEFSPSQIIDKKKKELFGLRENSGKYERFKKLFRK